MLPFSSGPTPSLLSKVRFVPMREKAPIRQFDRRSQLKIRFLLLSKNVFLHEAFPRSLQSAFRAFAFASGSDFSQGITKTIRRRVSVQVFARRVPIAAALRYCRSADVRSRCVECNAFT